MAIPVNENILLVGRIMKKRKYKKNHTMIEFTKCVFSTL